MSACYRDKLSSRSIVDLHKPLGYGSHCREGVNGNPILNLDYFYLVERLVQSLFRSIASPFDNARVPPSEGTPTVGYSTAHGVQSRSLCRRSFTYLDFHGATYSTQKLFQLTYFSAYYRHRSRSCVIAFVQCLKFDVPVLDAL
jgi:hypothetical protein